MVSDHLFYLLVTDVVIWLWTYCVYFGVLVHCLMYLFVELLACLMWLLVICLCFDRFVDVLGCLQ